MIKCDISGFYLRIYHHRIDNALQKATNNTEVVRRIREITSRLAKGVSYGLLLGGPASRILSELLLNLILNEKLHENEGLSIQKSKTHIMTAEEFRSSSGFSDGNNEELLEPDKLRS